MIDPVSGTVTTALLAAIAALWKKTVSQDRRQDVTTRNLEIRADACEKDRAEIREELAEVKQDLSIFATCSVEPCGAKEARRRSKAYSVARENNENFSITKE
jgi:hypothetical protein